MRTPVLASLLGAAWLCAASSCASFGTADTAGSDGGDGVAPSSDGVAPSSDAGSTDGGWCAARSHDFCADFDEGTFDKGWASVTGVGLSRDETVFMSSPACLLLDVPAAMSRREPFLSQTLTKKGGTVTAALDIRREPGADTAIPITVLGLMMPGTPSFEMGFVLRNSQGQLDVKTTPGINKELNFEIGDLRTFRHIEIRAELAAPAKITVTVDGIGVGTFDLPVLGVVPPPDIPRVDVRLGILTEGTPAQASKLRFDDLTLDVGK